MLLKTVRETYDRYVTDPASDPLLMKLRQDAQEERYRRVLMVHKLAYQAVPFVIDPDALDLITSLRTGVKLVEDFGPLLLEAPLPFDAVWMEFVEDVEGVPTESGVLIRKSSNRTLVCSFHRRAGAPLVEPMLFMTVDVEAKLDIVIDPFTAAHILDNYEGSQDERSSQFFEEAFPQTGWAILNAVGAMHLISAKDGPLGTDEEQMLSRPERRRMERKGELPVGAAPTITRIRLNDQGRLHLQALDDEEGGAGGARRRAHRVRGHYMRTARGWSWRKAHIRGLGQVNETTRVIEAKAGDRPSGKE